MSDIPDSPAYPAPLVAPAKEGRGCWFWGCSILAVLMLLAAACAAFVTYTAYSYVYDFTADAPMDIPVFEPKREQVEEVVARVKTFQDDIDAGRPAEIALTQDDINSLIVTNEELRELLPGKVFFEVVGDGLGVVVSAPMDRIPGFSGRYLNGRLSLAAKMENGNLDVRVKEFRLIGDRMLTEQELGALKKVNLAEEAMKDPEFQKSIKGIQELTIEDSTILLSGGR